MSPDDIFAAQFWPWPDPAIKRDTQGRVLFVNAAFLQLYGGTVQDWTGNVVGGWASPQGPGQPNRFETRMPMTAEAPEQVYDWVEMTMADGNAFALARNVTLFVQPTGPQPGAEVPPQMAPNAEVMASQAANAPQMQDMAHTAEAPAQADVKSDMPDFAAEVPEAITQVTLPEVNLQPEPNIETALPDTQTPAPAESASHEPVVFAEYTPDPEVLAQAPAEVEPVIASNVTEAEAPQAEAPAAPAAPQVEASTIPQETDNESEREFERRALPIENESAVLGNNWRDAVIAKAVGAGAVTAAAGTAAAATTEAPAPTAAEVSADEGGSKRILLAEDNAINALLTRTLLEADGHTVETVEDGLLAVEAMKTSTYDLIFMDMRMPNMDGLEATRKIRTLPNVAKDLPIIALTANAFDDDRNACFDSGMNDFMTKPVSAEELSEMVTQWTKPKEDRMAS